MASIWPRYGIFKFACNDTLPLLAPSLPLHLNNLRTRAIVQNEKYRVIVRDTATLEILHIYTCLDAITRLEWSPDSLFVLAAQYKRSLVQV